MSVHMNQSAACYPAPVTWPALEATFDVTILAIPWCVPTADYDFTTLRAGGTT